jgi:hypothetical protein
MMKCPVCNEDPCAEKCKEAEYTAADEMSAKAYAKKIAPPAPDSGEAEERPE